MPPSPITRGNLPLEGGELTRHEGARALSGLAQPTLCGHAVLVIAEDSLQCGRGIGRACSDLSGDGFGGLGRISHALSQDSDAM